MQDGSDIYMKYNFNSVTAEKMTAPNEDSELGNLSTGALAGIVICAVIVTIAVVTTAGFIL